jgi:hypothetical protein
MNIRGPARYADRFAAVVFNLTLIFAAAGLPMSQALAQDPAKAFPESYKLEFHNAWVKVTRVHYAPHQKLAAHQHTLYAAAYVYLSDSGPVVFKHIGLSYGAVTRPPAKAGTFRLYQAVEEIHEVENQSDLPSDFLRVEFKTKPVDEKSLRGRFHRETYPPGENFQKVQFENEQVRITRLVCAPGNSLAVSTDANQPALLVALSPSSFKTRGIKLKSAAFKLEMGQTRWMEVGQNEKIENAGSEPAELLRFDFKTEPLSRLETPKTGHQKP